MGGSNARRLMRPYLFGAVGAVLVPQQLPSCHGYTQPGGVRTARMRSNFNTVGAGVPEARRMQDLVFGAAGRKCQSSRKASLVMGVWG